MKVQGDFRSVNLATGEKTRSIVGAGERRDEVVGPKLTSTSAERKLTIVIRWLEANQPDVFRRGLWDALFQEIQDGRCHGDEMSEYHKIETLYERDLATFKVKPGVFKNRTYSLLKSWRWTEKVDGTNIRCIWKAGQAADAPTFPPQLTFGGKSDNAQIHADLIKWLYERVSAVKMAEIFPGVDAVIYGEGYGAGIQKGGGDYSPEKKLIVFDVLVDGKWWLAHEDVCDVAAKLGLDVVPDFGEMTLEEATELVRKGFKSRCAVNAGKDAEGLVGRPLEALFDKKGARLIVKLKTKDFAQESA